MEEQEVLNFSKEIIVSCLGMHPLEKCKIKRETITLPDQMFLQGYNIR